MFSYNSSSTMKSIVCIFFMYTLSYCRAATSSAITNDCVETERLRTPPNPCPPSIYRSPTGECNNINHRSWGARGDTFLRIFDPTYGNNVNSPRRATSGNELPLAIDVLVKVRSHMNTQEASPHVTSLLPLWGHLLFRDIAHFNTYSTNSTCCTQDEINPHCYVVSGKNCKEYTRTMAKQEVKNCKFDSYEQVNAASAFLDASAIYGNTLNEVNELRLFENGQVDINECDQCNDDSVLGFFQRLFLREHNRLASIISQIKTEWNDEKLFYEARKLVIAQLQHITYNEFIPAILGREMAGHDGMKLLTEKFYSQYSSQNRPGTFNEAATSVFPIFLSMLHGVLLNHSSTVKPPVLLSLNARDPLNEYSDVQVTDQWDPLELAIHRAREHGIPSYMEAMNVCRDYKPMYEMVRSGYIFNESAEENVALLKAYKSLDDVDLLIGALLEKPLKGAVFGPTINCIMALQFEKIRNSDRFWYENDIPPSSLSIDALKAVRDVTLAGLLCVNGAVQRSQPMAFYQSDPFLNAPLACDQFQGLQIIKLRKPNLPKQTPVIPNEKLQKKKHPKKAIDEEIVKIAFERAKDKLNERKKLEYELWLQNGGIDARSPDGTAASFSKANRNALSIANTSLLFEMASNEVLHILNSGSRRKRQALDDFTNNLQFIDVNSLATGSISPVTMEPQCEDLSAPCDTATPFRMLTGHCNNLRNPTLGQSLTVFSRLLPPVYEDGISAPRTTSVTGQELPNPRSISALIHPDISNLHTRYTLVTMQYAQFLDHDLTMTPIHKGFHESIPKCRPCDSAITVHPECNPIPIPPRDHYYPEANITDGNRMCFPFMRSLPGQQNLGPREQINQNTAYLDASQVYGENNCICRKLRGFSGRLNSTIHPTRGKELLPLSPSHPECKGESGYCFIAGDGRASEQPGLTAIHTTFLREHNRIVEGLRGVNPHWTGEQLFEHARRIMIAENQHITYNEFLPRILSWNAVNLYGLKLLPQGYYTEYNPSCNPAIVTEFAAAAFRIGHSLLRPHIPRMNAQHQAVDPPLLLRDGFFKIDNLLAPEILDEIMRGLVATPMETLDQFITGEVTNHLFEDKKIPFSGVDLIALNVQRARDHGIPSYNNYRALCNLKRAQTWDDLSREMPPEVITRLRRIYASVDDIDLFPGGMSERPLQGGLVGPTFACIIAIQFRQLRKCDRFWYENNDPVVKFTEAQLAEIRKVTLAKIICDNLDEPGEMQRAAFDLPSNFLNPRVPCDSMPQIDLSAWRENSQGCVIGGKTVQVGESAFPSPCTSCVCLKEGPSCASLRVTDCAQLAREWPRDVILNDDVCNAQCGLVLQTNIPTNLRPPSQPTFQRSARSRQVFSDGFQFPDLAKFLG